MILKNVQFLAFGSAEILIFECDKNFKFAIHVSSLFLHFARKFALDSGAYVCELLQEQINSMPCLMNRLGGCDRNKTG